MSLNVNLSNLENVLQRNLREDSAWEFNFTAFGAQFWKCSRSEATMVVPSWIPFMYQSAPKNSVYVTDACQELANLAIDKVQYNTKNYGN